MASINHLPVEILQEIFHTLAAIDNYAHMYPYSTARNSEAPMLLTYICPDWREISIGMPTLWTSITISELGYQKHGDWVFALWLQRSRGLPLTLNLCPPSPVNVHHNRMLEKIFTMSVDEMYRWKFVGFDAGFSRDPHSRLFTWFTSIPDCGDAPLLEGLALDLGNLTSYSRDFAVEACTKVICSRFPNLRQLDLGEPYSQSATTSMKNDLHHLPLQNLTHFRGRLPARGDVRSISLFQNAVELSLHFLPNTFSGLPESQPFTMITLPLLISLTIRLNVFTNFLPHFNFPSLQHLKIEDECVNIDLPLAFSAFRSFHQRSPNIQHLTIQSTNSRFQAYHEAEFLDKKREFLQFLASQCASISEVEVLVRVRHRRLLDAFEETSSPLEQRYRCVERCGFPHFGWTRRADGVLGADLPEMWMSVLDYRWRS